MKTLTTIKRSALVSGLMLAGYLPASAAVDFIEQVDLATGLVYQVYVEGPEEPGSKSGTQISPMPVGSEGSTYQLYAKGLDPDNTVYLLDEKYVASYTPEATITITSEDPHPTPRTRADEPFTVDIKVEGLLAPGPDVPDAALNVYFQQLRMNYDSELNRAPTDGTAEEILTEDFFIVENSELRRTGMTKLTSDVYFKERGEEIFRAFALPDADLDWLQIASGRIQIWPIADAEIIGMAANQRITRSLPNLVISLNDLYPDSTTTVQVYEGTQALGTEGVQVEGSRISFNSIVPQDAQILVRNWDKYAPEDGTYTLEVITTTPFDNRAPERLAWITFSVDRTITMKGSATTSE
ncbi:MAG: hypothetical protein KJO79_08385 [Verrucomicrobiae bacterium]|nr:hypothetical protein [Verrucomicrobiae bacterium]NNJ87184.1 hypothetical protein [Akkermansiaceae bacterium]